ncbi:MAG: carbamoyl-phosphate synthase large subunit [Deltaproteobacteria bacterium]|nr:carbamoyl-phosphate synthase large subunit [Deltaproteobacteria bacterium]
MPKRTDIKKVLIIGSGPIVIGQACEFDYSGTQACKALREEGYSVVLINSNPATIMTDPEFADRTYIEPLTVEMIEKIIEKERPDVLLPTLGGQSALNLAIALAHRGILKRYGVELIGASVEAIEKAEDREKFKKAIQKVGLELPQSRCVRSVKEGLAFIDSIGFPAILRPSFTLGGTGGSIAYNREEFEAAIEWGIASSPVHEVLVEKSVLGWKEFELEVMRDRKDNVVIICSIENFDPMGIHTGDSITVAPAQTLTDKEYQILRDAAIRIIREIGVDTGGSNIQFAVNPKDGRMVVIEMNPRVSRSSALASKATGFPIAKIAAKLAVGYTLDEIPNDITRETPACFEPTIDYVVTKVPRFAFDKFPQADDTLTTQMKSVGEAMAIGRTFKESLQKAIRSLEIDRCGLDPVLEGDISRQEIEEKLKRPNADRLWAIADAYRHGFTTPEIYRLTAIDPWFLDNVCEIVEFEKAIQREKSGYGWLKEAKRLGFSDRRLAKLTGTTEEAIRSERKKQEIFVTFKRVDTCAAEFEAHTPYLYSTYEKEDEALIGDQGKKKVVILGGGPNRIGQGIEFDYCCVHGVLGLREEGYDVIMVNCNPETVSTDYDTSDKLYFEPLTLEDVLNIVHRERPEGVIVQFGGQTPLRLSVPLEKAGVRLLGTSSDSIDRAEDRERFQQLLEKLRLKQPPNGIARSLEAALKAAEKVGYPILVRPSYVLGGRGMKIVHEGRSLQEFMAEAVKISPEHPVLIDKFLEDAIEVDVDALSDGEEVYVGGIMEHIEEAGVHSGDSACSLPPFSLSPEIQGAIHQQTVALARELEVKGLMNVQYAIYRNEIYILEVNPRASRTVPFVSKATGVPLAKLAAKVMMGKKLKEFNLHGTKFSHVAVKEAVFPFIKFPNVDTILGPEMKSTGEVMGIDADFGSAYAKAQIAAGSSLPLQGTVVMTVKDSEKSAFAGLARELGELGFKICATQGTAAYFSDQGISVQRVNKVKEGRPHIVDAIKNGEIALVFNTVSSRDELQDSYSIRRTSLVKQVPYSTTLEGARAMVAGIRALKKQALQVCPLQEYLAATHL